MESAHVIIVNIDDLCRVCLVDLCKNSNSVQNMSLQSSFEGDVTYQQIFKDCTGFELDGSEPQNVCGRCAENLQMAFELRRKCSETQKILEEWLKIEAFEQTPQEMEREEILIEKKDPTDSKPFVCEICDARATTKAGIGTHIKTQHLHHKFHCIYCGSQYRSRLVLNSHIRRVHPEKKSRLRCEYCEYTTPNFLNLFRHRLTHTRKKLHKCETCARVFVTKDNWRTHIATHSDERPFTCEICQASFKTKKSLGVHRKCHQAPEYECPVCHRGFLTNQLMRSHVTRVHPEFVLPPPGTIFNKTWRIKKATQELKESVARLGFDAGIVKSVIIDESYLKSAKRYVRTNKIQVEK